MNRIVVKYVLVAFFAFGVSFTYFKFIAKQYYTATTVVYPASTLNPQYLLEGGLRFGDEKELNELIEVLKSNDLAEKIISKIKSDERCFYCKSSIQYAVKELKKHTKVERSINRSVVVSVDNESPEMAAFIANLYVEMAYQHISQLVVPSINSQLIVVSELYEEKEKEVAFLRDTLEKLEALGESKVSGLIQVKTPRYRINDTRFESELRKLSELKHQKEQIEGIIKKNVPPLYVISSATTGTDPSKPKALLLSSAFMVFSLFSFSVLIYRKTFFNLLAKE